MSIFIDISRGRELQRQGTLKQLRIRLGLTQQQVADSWGVHVRTYRRYENTEYLIPRFRLLTLG